MYVLLFQEGGTFTVTNNLFHRVLRLCKLWWVFEFVAGPKSSLKHAARKKNSENTLVLVQDHNSDCILSTSSVSCMRLLLQWGACLASLLSAFNALLPWRPFSKMSEQQSCIRLWIKASFTNGPRELQSASSGSTTTDFLKDLLWSYSSGKTWNKSKDFSTFLKPLW